MIFLDTNVAIGFLTGHPLIRARFAEALGRSEEIMVSAIVAFELEYGAAWSDRPESNRAGLQEFFRMVSVAPFGPEAAQSSGEIRAHLRRVGTPVGPYDLLIAGHALSERALLITNNIREFSRIPGLKTEDWLSP